MNGNRRIVIACVGLVGIAWNAPAQEPVAAVNSFPLTRQEPLDIGEVAAIGPRLITYQGLIENAGGPIDNQSMVVQFRAFPALAGGTQRGLTVTQTLLASAVRKGVFSVEMDADELALPDNADDTYLEVAVCSPAPCTPVALAPRQHVTAAALAVSARNLGGVAEPAADGSLVVKSSAAASGVMSLKNQGATATMSLNAGSSEIAASKPDAAAPLKLASKNSADNSQTYMMLDNAAKVVTFGGGEYDETATAGISPPPKMTLNLGGAEVAMSASRGASPAAFDLKYDGESAARIGEDPEATGQAVMMFGPEGLLLSKDALQLDSNVAAPPGNYVRIRVVQAAQANTAALGPSLQIETVSNNVPTPMMAIDGNTGNATFFGQETNVAALKLADTGASNTAGSGAVVELVTAAPASNTAGAPAAQLELKVNGNTVDRWTGLGAAGAYGNTPNRIGGSSANSVAPGKFGAVIAGGGIPGYINEVIGELGTIGGGWNNNADREGTVAGGYANTAGAWAAVGGGSENNASGNIATIGGGENNIASGLASTVPGGQFNEAGGAFSFAGGYKANIRDVAEVGSGFYGDSGTFMWADWTEPAFTSDGYNKFLVRATGGTTFYSNSGLTAGVTLAAGGGSWSSVSDQNLKENFVEIDKEALLEKLSAISVTTWNYKSQDASIRHIGPMGQDFHAAFGVGETDAKITTIDADGVALAAIQGLYQIVQDKDCEIADLKARLVRLEAFFETSKDTKGDGQ